MTARPTRSEPHIPPEAVRVEAQVRGYQAAAQRPVGWWRGLCRGGRWRRLSEAPASSVISGGRWRRLLMLSNDGHRGRWRDSGDYQVAQHCCFEAEEAVG